mmetsp:Transcript_18605/g.26182  ORF Transcript_18605/g.26182 Transcript_18605/m.26182 type:complete len:151 (+) Transcript_18605:616-1068(+)
MFVPLMLMFPEVVKVPVSQISLVSSLNAKEHWSIGEVLTPLREEGVLIIGSGMSYHGFFHELPRGVSMEAASKSFDDYLSAAVLELSGAKRKEALCEWEKGQYARVSHPREEHLIPLMVVAAAAKDDKATRIFHTGGKTGLVISAYQFGV